LLKIYRITLINGGRKIGDCCFWECRANKITEFRIESPGRVTFLFIEYSKQKNGHSIGECANLNALRLEDAQELSKIDGLAYQLCFLPKAELTNSGTIQTTPRACQDCQNENSEGRTFKM
jgi:hypothetical protein